MHRKYVMWVPSKIHAHNTMSACSVKYAYKRVGGKSYILLACGLRPRSLVFSHFLQQSLAKPEKTCVYRHQQLSASPKHWQDFEWRISIKWSVDEIEEVGVQSSRILTKHMSCRMAKKYLGKQQHWRMRQKWNLALIFWHMHCVIIGCILIKK